MVKDEKGYIQLFEEGLSQKRHGARENLERLLNVKYTSFSSFIKISHSYLKLKVNLKNKLNSSNPLYLFLTVMLSQISLRS